MKTKICSNKKCLQPKKLLSGFSKNKNTKDGLCCWCKECMRQYKKNYYLKNNKKILKKSKISYLKNKKKISKYQADYYKKHKLKIQKCTQQYRIEHKQQLDKYFIEYRIKNKDKQNNYQKQYFKNPINRERIRIYKRKYKKNKLKTDIKFKIKENLRGRLITALHGKYKSLKTMFLIGCEIDYLMFHIQEQFTKGMSWDNYGFGDDKWHIDHIKPCALFDLSKKSKQLICFNYINLQPLWQIDNLRKWKNY